MCQCHDTTSCFGCSHGLSRRGFLRGCGAAAAAGPKRRARRSAWRWCSSSNCQEREIWPYPGYDCAAREREVVKALRDGCPQIEFVPISLAHPADVQKAVAMKDKVDGYLVYTVTLNWWWSRRRG